MLTHEGLLTDGHFGGTGVLFLVMKGTASRTWKGLCMCTDFAKLSAARQVEVINDLMKNIWLAIEIWKWKFFVSIQEGVYLLDNQQQFYWLPRHKVMQFSLYFPNISNKSKKNTVNFCDICTLVLRKKTSAYAKISCTVIYTVLFLWRGYTLTIGSGLEQLLWFKTEVTDSPDASFLEF